MPQSARVAAMALTSASIILMGAGAGPASANGLKKRPISMVEAVHAAGIIIDVADGAGGKVSVAEVQSSVGRLAADAKVALNYVRPMSGDRHVFRLARSVSYDEAMRMAARIRAQNPRIVHAEPDIVLRRQLVPNDYAFDSLQWNLKVPNAPDGNRGGANLPAAWDVARGAGVVVAVLDTGSISHPDLDGVFVGGYDFISDVTLARDNSPRDGNPADEGDWREVGECDIAGGGRNTVFQPSTWHGAFAAGVIAAATNNYRDTAGVAFESKVLPVRVIGKCGEGLLSDIADAIRWAAGGTVPGAPANPNPARVINLGLSAGAACSQAMQGAIDEARARGAIVVAATGNEGMLGIGTPANCAGVLAVTAHNFQGDNADYANVGAGTGISGPGGGNCATPDGNGFSCLTSSPSSRNFLVTSLGLHGIRGPTSTNDNPTQSLSGPTWRAYVGTSAAAPHVAGAAALLLSSDPQQSERQVRGVLQRSSRPFSPGTFCASLPQGVPAGSCGSGMLDAKAALDFSAQKQPLASSVLPVSRSVLVGGMATVFATIINAGAQSAEGCAIAPVTPGLGAFTYQTTDPATNALVGTADTPVDIPAGKYQSFVVAFTPAAELAPTDVQLRFDCFNSSAVATLTGVNTVLLSASSTPVPDVIALAATAGNTGIVNIPGINGTGAFAVATANVGSSGTITASVDTAGTTLPVNMAICQTNPLTGACEGPVASAVTTTIAAGATRTFAVFVGGRGNIPLNAATSRVFVRFRDDSGAVRGATSVAVRTQ